MELVVAVFKPEASILFQMGGVIRVVEEDGGVQRLLFCVLFWVQTRRICLQCFKIFVDVIGTLDGYCGRVFV